MWPAGIEAGADDGEGDHGAEMNDFAEAFEEGVAAEADVVEDDLEPDEPEDGEEADIGCYCCYQGYHRGDN